MLCLRQHTCFDSSGHGMPCPYNWFAPLSAGLSGYDSEYLLKISAPLVPPNPNEFESA